MSTSGRLGAAAEFGCAGFEWLSHGGQDILVLRLCLFRAITWLLPRPTEDRFRLGV